MSQPYVAPTAIFLSFAFKRLTITVDDGTNARLHRGDLVAQQKLLARA
jgi:hypothetical protein